MSLNLLPEKIVKTRSDGNGGHHSEVYTLEAWANQGCLAFIIICIFLIAILPISGLILFIYYCLFTKDGMSSVFVPLLFSIYLLIDFKSGWILSQLTAIFYDAKGVRVGLNLGMTTIAASIVSLLFGTAIYNFSYKKNSIFVFFMLAMFLGCYVIVTSIF